MSARSIIIILIVFFPLHSFSQKIVVPDTAFSNYLVENFDLNGDGAIQQNEADAVSWIVIDSDNIKSAKGIEACRNLVRLEVVNKYIDSLNLNGMSELYLAFLTTPNLSYIGLDGVSEITWLAILKSKLLELDISDCQKLTSLEVLKSEVSKLDFSKNAKLEMLNLVNCAINQLEIGNLSNLQHLYLGEMEISSLSLHGLSNLSSLNCRNIAINNIDFGSNHRLREISISSCPSLTSIELQNLPRMFSLEIVDCGLTELDISGLATSLEHLWVPGNSIASLDLTNNSRLVDIDLSRNPLNEIDFSENNLLHQLRIFATDIESIDLSSASNLRELWVNGNNELRHINIQNNSINEKFRVGNCPKLEFVCVDSAQVDYVVSCIKSTGSSNVEVSYDCQSNEK